MRGWIVVALLLSGCGGLAGEPGPSDGEVTVMRECSKAVRDDARPDGQPWGSFDHSIQNGLAVPTEVSVAHMHKSGCSLATFTAILAPGATMELTYDDTLWETETRVVAWNDESRHLRVDWACTWDQRVTPRGLEPQNEAMVCA